MGASSHVHGQKGIAPALFVPAFAMRAHGPVPGRWRRIRFATILAMQGSEAFDAFPKGMGWPATQAVMAAGYTKLEDLAGASEADLLELHGVGPKAIRVIKQALADGGHAPLRP